MTSENVTRTQGTSRKHYWLREDFEEMMRVIPEIDRRDSGSEDASCTLAYPKSTRGAVGELRLRGLTCDGDLLVKLVDDGVVDPGRGHSLVTDKEGNVGMVPSTRLLMWDRKDIDAAAEWLYENERWGSWTHFCWVSNLRYGQAVKAHRVACVKYGLGFTLSFDVPGLLTVIEPSPECADYAYIRFYPMGTKLVPQGASE